MSLDLLLTIYGQPVGNVDVDPPGNYETWEEWGDHLAEQSTEVVVPQLDQKLRKLVKKLYENMRAFEDLTDPPMALHNLQDGVHLLVTGSATPGKVKLFILVKQKEN